MVGSSWDSFFATTKYWFDELRSPLLLLFLPSEIEGARLAMIGYLLISTLLIYYITLQVTKKPSVAF
ncbi:MAG: hypothetical protein JSV76_06345, partial [Candidatus Bathyarchaeota archaeon]